MDKLANQLKAIWAFVYLCSTLIFFMSLCGVIPLLCVYFTDAEFDYYVIAFYLACWFVFLRSNSIDIN